MEKMYAGARLRQLREGRSMTQSELARLLEISPSYVNQLEHNGRPLTMPVLLKLTETFGVDTEFFAARDTARLVADVREVFGDNTVSGAISAGEVDALTTTLPEVARTLVALHRRYREAVENIATLVTEQGLDRSTAQQPHEEIRDWFYLRRNHVTELDAPAEKLAAELRLHPGEVRSGLAAGLLDRHGVKVVSESLGADQHHFDTREKTLRLSPALRPGQAAFRLASELALLEAGDVIDRLVDDGKFSGDTARRLARIGLANYYAGALVLPYRVFLGAAERYRYDITRLSDHFGVGFETICHRLSTLQRPGTRGVPFSFVRVDRAGNISKRQSATGFHFSRVGGSCPLWIVYEAFSSPGRILTQVAELPDGKKYFWLARTVSRAAGGHGDPGKTFAIGLGCELRHARRLVYSDGLALGTGAAVTPIGMGCKVCERPACPQRAFPAIGKPMRVDEHSSSLLPYPPLS
ncbi:short-chain fatty acyl-CoA regulator family protein [Amycolatopsis sp. BJA-103]|uniref:short-chain fatty acyl-CoA regulator family protein n=1 Tax=unclassified Amycolatopsis TaxID=2618356 RepID=UPI000C76FD6D|nr:short-chain fatty acyl-CoA regulator family protein [Amycolatopsis sp. BJA-103]AUI59438.1 Cro/Cl family transcriptional regulator [Amycolatopsis sp. BJA-103]PNE17121.1 Cro/Cl family transcriptional regulator [Amycolatopsis sp. BJA-103]